MEDLNSVVLSGRLTRDPDLHATPGGSTVMGLGLACNGRAKNRQTGQWEDHANFFDVAVFGARAEALSRILHKGSWLCVKGSLRWSQWERDGVKRSKIEVVVDELVLPPRASQDAPCAHDGACGAPGAHGGAQAPMRASTRGPVAEAVYDDADIPF